MSILEISWQRRVWRESWKKRRWELYVRRICWSIDRFIFLFINLWVGVCNFEGILSRSYWEYRELYFDQVKICNPQFPNPTHITHTYNSYIQSIQPIQKNVLPTPNPNPNPLIPPPIPKNPPTNGLIPKIPHKPVIDEITALALNIQICSIGG